MQIHKYKNTRRIKFYSPSGQQCQYCLDMSWVQIRHIPCTSAPCICFLWVSPLRGENYSIACNCFISATLLCSISAVRCIPGFPFGAAWWSRLRKWRRLSGLGFGSWPPLPPWPTMTPTHPVLLPSTRPYPCQLVPRARVFRQGWVIHTFIEVSLKVFSWTMGYLWDCSLVEL